MQLERKDKSIARFFISSESKIIRLVMPMGELKDIDRKIVLELLKNSKQSDRQLGKKLGISQATVTRKRKMLEKELIAGYTFVPNWKKLGYELFAITFVKIKSEAASKEKYQSVRQRGFQWLMTQPNILMAGSSRGMGMDAFNIAVFKSYAEYDEWFTKFRLEMGDLVEDTQSVFVNLLGNEVIKPLHFRYLSETK
jgi:DNA-binding Lrp family transcriptional regulator